MIVSHQHQFVYYGLPRCASTSLHKMLEAIEWSGDASWRKGRQHAIDPAPTGFYKWTVVRNPFGRAVSLWMYSRYQFTKFNNGVWFEDLRSFLNWCIREMAEKGRNGADSFYCWPMTEWFAFVKPDLILKQEELPYCLYTLPVFRGKTLMLGYENWLGHDQWAGAYGPDEEALVLQHFASDFETYHYDRHR